MAHEKPVSRFANLELNEDRVHAHRMEEELKGEGYYLTEAQMAFENGRFEKALRDYAKVLEYNPQNSGAWAGQVRMLIEMGEFREAKLWADKAMERFPNLPELLAAKAVALARTGDLRGAMAFSDASFEEKGDIPYIWLARADVMLARKERNAAYCLERAHAMAPNDWLLHWLASRVQYYYHKFSMALQLAQQALAADSTRGVVWLQVGLCQKELGMLAVAQGSFEQALELDPACRPAQVWLNKLQTVSWASVLQGFWRRIFLR